MHDNCAAYPSAKSVDGLRSARGWGYAIPGRAVEEVYYANIDKSRDETIAVMKEKVEALYKEGKKVSLHCVSEADYKKKNIVDIPYSSVLASNRKSFEIALMGMAQEVKNARYAPPSKGEIYISRLIVEDRCWHVEIDQLNKPLPNQNKNAALTNCRPKKGGQRCSSQPPAKTSESSFLAFLDHWF